MDCHDDTVSLLARKLREDCGSIVAVEQRRPELDYRNKEGDMVEARMDLVVTLQGNMCLLDVIYADVRAANAEAAADGDERVVDPAPLENRGGLEASGVPSAWEEASVLGEDGAGKVVIERRDRNAVSLGQAGVD